MTAVVSKQSSVTQLKSSLRSSVTFPESRPDQGLHRTVQSPYCSPSDHTPRPENKLHYYILHTQYTHKQTRRRGCRLHGNTLTLYWAGPLLVPDQNKTTDYIQLDEVTNFLLSGETFIHHYCSFTSSTKTKGREQINKICFGGSQIKPDEHDKYLNHILKNQTHGQIYLWSLFWSKY